MRHSLYLGAPLLLGLLMVVGLPIGALFLPIPAAHGQVGPPGEVINQARKMLAVTPSDTVDLVLGPTRFVYNSNATPCNIAAILADDTAAVTLTAVPIGTTLPIRAKRIMATNTTCTAIIGMW